MAHDENFTRFFCFLSLFAAAMLGVVIANSLLLLFICWELVGLTSYLLIGFWYHKPSAAAAAKKAFITTRIGDVAFLLGMVWLYSQTGTLLFYDDGARLPGSNPRSPKLVAQTTGLGMAVSTGDRLADFLRRGWQIRPGAAARLAAGRDGRPDARQRADPRGDDGGGGCVSRGAGLSADEQRMPASWSPASRSTALQVVTWIGAITAVFAALHRRRAERHQTHPRLLHGFATRLHDDGPGRRRRGGRNVPSDHARILQSAAVHGRRLGDSRLPRGTGHPPHGRLAQIHAGHVCDVCGRHDGAVRVCRSSSPASGARTKFCTRRTAGAVSHMPFYLGLFGALLTAFYMTRQVCYVFFGKSPAELGDDRSRTRTVEHGSESAANIRTRCQRSARKPRRHDHAADHSGGVRHCCWASSAHRRGRGSRSFSAASTAKFDFSDCRRRRAAR